MSLIRGVGACAALATALVILRLAVTLVRPGGVDPRLAVFTSIGALMLVQLAFVVSLARLRMKAGSAFLLAVPSVIAVIGISILVAKTNPDFVGTPLFSLVLGLRDVFLIIFAGSLGCGISYIVRESNILLPAAVFAAFVDFWSVTWGPLSHILEKKPAIIEAASVHLPTPVPGVPGTMIGMGDFLFLALFFTVLYRFCMNVKGAFWVGYALLTLSMLVVLRWGGAIPALVPMSLAIVGMNIKYFKLKRQELLATLYVGLMTLALLIASGIYLFRR